MKSCWVYVMSKVLDDGLVGPIKVGISTSPGSRLDTIQTACPFKIALAYTFECPNREIAEYIERSFHDTQRGKLLHGEWFDYQPTEAIHLLCIAFRVALTHNINDKTLIEPSLEMCGVLAAEKKWNLAVPRG